MPISEKELTAFLWQQPRACEARGLTINQGFYALGRRYHHLQLGPYGEAQQVSVRFWPDTNCYFVQVVLSTTGAIGARLYLRAKQELSALYQLLVTATQGLELPRLSCVLVGKRVETTGNFVYALNLDYGCRAFTYSYDAAGLHFQAVPRGWAVSGSTQSSALAELATDLLAERTDALTIAELGRADALATLSATEPAELADLVVTPAGVLASPGAPQPAPVGQLSLFTPPALPVDPAAATLGQRLAQLAQHVGGGKVGHLAKAVGLPAPVLHNLTANRHAPSFETLRHLLTALPQVSPAWLVLGQGPMLATLETNC